MTNLEYLKEFYQGELIGFSNPDFDDAIIGITTDGIVVYDYNKMVESLMRTDGMSQEDATEWIDYNTIRSIPYAGPKAPAIMYSLEEYR